MKNKLEINVVVLNKSVNQLKDSFFFISEEMKKASISANDFSVEIRKLSYNLQYRIIRKLRKKRKKKRLNSKQKHQLKKLEKILFIIK